MEKRELFVEKPKIIVLKPFFRLTRGTVFKSAILLNFLRYQKLILNTGVGIPTRKYIFDLFYGYIAPGLNAKHEHQIIKDGKSLLSPV